MASQYYQAGGDWASSKEKKEMRQAKGTRPEDHKALLHDVLSGLTGLVWKGILYHNINIFSFHPLLNSLAFFLASQSTLLLQPTHRDAERYRGTWAHFLLNTGANVALLSSLAVIETIKSTRPETRFRSPHAILGLATYGAISLQTIVGVVQFFAPWLLGGERNAHKVYKYHRLLGYCILTLGLVTIIAATRTGYNMRVLHIPTSGIVGAVALLLIGIGARIDRSKLPGGEDKQEGVKQSPRLAPRSLRRSFATSIALRDEQAGQAARPPTAPKAILNTRHIRNNVEAYAKNCRDRNYGALAENAAKIRNLLEQMAKLQIELNAPRAKIKRVEKSIAQLSSKRAQETATEDELQQLQTLLREAQDLKSGAQAMMEQRVQNMEQVQRLAISLPNMTSSETPLGDDPKLVRYLNFNPNAPPACIRSRTSHVDIGTSLGLLDFSSSATSTGWGFYFLINEAALLEHALVQYALSVALRRGWKAVSPPSIVYSHIAAACGFQPRDQNGEQQIWSIEQSKGDKAKPQRSLAATAEIPLAAMYANREIEASRLPLKFVGASRCYRAEAGARGVDTKGLYRVHEFTKVELFGWTDVLADPSAKQPSAELFDELLDIQIEILTSLGLPCRVLEMPSTDLGASATRKRDIEALFPSRIRSDKAVSSSENIEEALESGWGEVTSASICTDYQSRRLGTRIAGRASKKGEATDSNDVRFPHTINGTAMAIPRVIAAILENGYDETKGAVIIPQVLRPFMGGRETIGSRDQ
ncbi:Serine--tRNA ligase, mitochondrial [Ascosphaera pollenicola]|nr:Serine--tRNA ligase, mitochondrial [Ascosphaera pollenicola]